MMQPPYISDFEYSNTLLSVKEKYICEIIFQVMNPAEPVWHQISFDNNPPPVYKTMPNKRE